MNVDTIIAYVLELYADDAAGSPQRFELGDNLRQAVSLFSDLKRAQPVDEDGDVRDGWMNLVALTARSPELAGTLIDQHRWGSMINPEDFEPDPDNLTRAELVELAHLPWASLNGVLDEWNHRLNGVLSSHHGVGLFLDLLNEAGWQVVPLPPVTPIGELLPPPTD